MGSALEQNKTHFNAACEKLEQWADDMVLSAEKVLLDTKEQIKALRRRARQAIALAEQHEIQEKIWKLEQPAATPASGDLQSRRRDHREARPTHRFAGAQNSTADRDGNALYHPFDGQVVPGTIDERQGTEIRMSQKHQKLILLLKELFQLDQPDLDFGIYRVLHAKSAEVSQFLDKDLLPQVQAAFGQYKTADKAELEKELSKVIADIEAAEMDPEGSPKIKDLRDRVKSDAADIDALEAEVYDHLFNFFRRYYAEGDFLAKRVYKQDVYALPYEGEEVTLHWANKDQYYIKTSEYLRDYAFRLRPDADKKPLRVHFRLVDGIVKLTRSESIDPQDTGLEPAVNPPCWASKTAVVLNLTIPSAILNGSKHPKEIHVVEIPRPVSWRRCQ